MEGCCRLPNRQDPMLDDRKQNTMGISRARYQEVLSSLSANSTKHPHPLLVTTLVEFMLVEFMLAKLGFIDFNYLVLSQDHQEVSCCEGTGLLRHWISWSSSPKQLSDSAPPEQQPDAEVEEQCDEGLEGELLSIQDTCLSYIDVFSAVMALSDVHISGFGGSTRKEHHLSDLLVKIGLCSSWKGILTLKKHTLEFICFNN